LSDQLANMEQELLEVEEKKANLQNEILQLQGENKSLREKSNFDNEEMSSKLENELQLQKVQA
jgi:predicted  nucleic acid-binding Zn-ribbon protein